MPRTFHAVLIAAAFGFSLALPAFGQDTTTETDTEAAEQPSTGSTIENQLSMGTDADAPSDLGQPYTAETIGDWEMRCIRTELEEDPCQMYQLMDDGEGAPVAEFSLFRLPEGGRAVAGATVVVPLETALPNQLSIQVDGGSVRRYPYAFCAAVGCYARIGLTAEDVAAFRRGNVATMTIVPAAAPDQKVELALSLTGFTASFEKVSVIEQ
ncbi:MAG: invasion associated locus B family protein [Pseudomonadota bacterium]